MKQTNSWNCCLLFFFLVFAHAANAQHWATNGNNISNTNTGRVGIGTSNPIATLHVSTNDGGLAIGRAGFSPTLLFLNDLTSDILAAFQTEKDGTDGGRLKFYTKPDGASFSAKMNLSQRGRLTLGDGGSEGLAQLHVRGAGTSTGYTFFTEDALGTDRFVIRDNGDVGIGTIFPSFPLEIQRNDSTGLRMTSYANVTVPHVNQSFRSSRGTSSTPVGLNDGDEILRMELQGHDGTGFRDAARIRGFVDGVPGGNDMPGGLAFDTTPDGTASVTERLRITSGGNVGIGTAAPATRLHVIGDVTVTGNISAKYQDIAEWVPASQPIADGTVVILDVARKNAVVPSVHSYDTRVAGVVSAKPGIVLGEAADSKVKVATAGRVRVRVDATRGPIHVGDLLVTSDKEGVAMRSEALEIGGVEMHRPGTLIGKALEGLRDGVGEILVLLSLQ